MSTADQRKRLKAHYTNFNVMYAEWLAYGDIHQRPKYEPLPDDLKKLAMRCKNQIRDALQTKGDLYQWPLQVAWWIEYRPKN